MHNLRTVFNFEFIRAVKKKSFWISVLLFPIMIAAVFGIVIASNQATDEQINKAKDERFSLLVTDKSGSISPDMLSALKATSPETKQLGIDSVKNGSVDAYFYYPTDLAKEKIEVYSKDVGIFNNGKYDAVAKMLLQESSIESVSSNTKAILEGKITFSVTSYKDGVVFNGINTMIVPAIFLVLFYFVIALFGGQMMNSTIEEKENRVIEMLLTSVEPRTLIVGKILALVSLGLLQMLLIIIPALIGYIAFHNQLSMPGLDFSSLVFDWGRIGIGALLFILSFLVFTGLLVAIGAAVPTAKEAGPFIGVVMMLIFGPLYAASLFISNPEAAFVQFMSYFPLTAPIPLLLRNAVGNLQPHEVIIAVTIMTISTIVIARIAVRIFRYGALEYSRKLSFKEILGRS